MPPQLVMYLKVSIEGSDVLFHGRSYEGDGAWVKSLGGQRADLGPYRPTRGPLCGGESRHSGSITFRHGFWL